MAAAGRYREGKARDAQWATRVPIDLDKWTACCIVVIPLVGILMATAARVPVDLQQISGGSFRAFLAVCDGYGRFLVEKSPVKWVCRG